MQKRGYLSHEWKEMIIGFRDKVAVFQAFCEPFAEFMICAHTTKLKVPCSGKMFYNK